MKRITMPSKQNVIYIMGPSHSGSTLLTFLLSNHREISTIGELKATSMGPIENYHCSCGQLIEDCDFWKNVAAEMKKVAPLFNLANFHTHFILGDLVFDKLMYASVRGPEFESLRECLINNIPTVRQRLERILLYNKQMASIVSSMTPGKYFMDSSKDPARLKQLLKIKSWNIKVIQIVRDGRGTCCSYKTRYRMDIAKAANEWKQTCQEFPNVTRYIAPGNHLLIRYEDLCRNPENTMTGLYDFLDLAPSLTTEIQHNEQHILGNPMRMNIDKGISLDEKWKTALSTKELATFQNIAGKINHSFGYSC